MSGYFIFSFLFSFFKGVCTQPYVSNILNMRCKHLYVMLCHAFSRRFDEFCHSPANFHFLMCLCCCCFLVSLNCSYVIHALVVFKYTSII